jgi:hypothetical protein
MEQGVNRSAPSLVNFFSRGTSDRSVHRDALSAAALRFEATPLPPRVFVGPAELPLCAALIRGGSISCHPPPTEPLNGPLMPANIHALLVPQAGGTSGHGIGHFSNEVTVTFATQLSFCHFAPNRYKIHSGHKYFRLLMQAVGTQVGLTANEQSAWRSVNYYWNAICTIASHKLSRFK